MAAVVGALIEPTAPAFATKKRGSSVDNHWRFANGAVKMARRRGGGGRSRLPRYLGTAEVAGLLGVTTGRVRQLALAGELVEALRVGGRRLYRATTVQRFQRAWATPRRASE